MFGRLLKQPLMPSAKVLRRCYCSRRSRCNSQVRTPKTVVSPCMRGATLAVPPVLALAWFAGWVFAAESASLADAVIAFAAAALVLYVSGWLFMNRKPTVFQSYLVGAVHRALSQRNAWAIGALAFLVVFREGAEVVLFVRPLSRPIRQRRLSSRSGCPAGSDCSR